MTWASAEVRAGGQRLPVEAGVPSVGVPVAGWVIVPSQSGRAPHHPSRPAAEAALLATLHRAGLATLSVDLLTPPEAASPAAGFNTALLGARLAAVTRWLSAHREGRGRRVGYVAAGQAAAAALWAAAELRTEVSAVISLGGRVDLAARRLPEVVAPVLLVVNRRDRLVLGANRAAHAQLNPVSRLVIAPSFRYLRYWLSEPAALDRVLAREWLAQHVLRQAVAPEHPRLTDWLPNLNLRGKAMAAATVLALVASLAGPPQPVEAASTVSVSGLVLTYTADAGQSNNLTIDNYVFDFGFYYESGYYISDLNHPITAGTGCTQNGTNAVHCVAEIFNFALTEINFTSLVLNAGDQNDTLTLAGAREAITLNGEAGADTFNVRTTAAAATVNTGTGNDTVNAGSNAPGLDGTLLGLVGGLHVQGGDNDVLNLGDKGNPLADPVNMFLGAGTRTITSPSHYSISLGTNPLAGEVNFWSAPAADVINIESTLSGEKLNILGDNFAGQYDTVNVGTLTHTAQGIQGPVHISNPQDYTDVSIDNSVDGTGRNITFSAGIPATLSGLAPANITFTRADMRQVNMVLGSGSDTVTIDDSWTNGVPGNQVPRTFQGGNGNDVFRLTADGSTNGGFVFGGNDRDTVSYELWSSGLTIDLGSPTLPGFGAITSIENATGSSGNDLLRGGPLAVFNVLNGGAGTDTVETSGDFYFTLHPTTLTREFYDTDTLQAIEAVSLTGTASNQQFLVHPGSSYSTTMHGLGGDDTMIGGDGNDYISGGGENDRLRGRGGNDTLLGGAGIDTIHEDADVGVLRLFDDSMTGDLGTDSLGGDFEAAWITGGNSNNLLDLSGWADGPASIQAGGGNDTIRLGTGNYNDIVDGGAPATVGGDRLEQSGVNIAMIVPLGPLWLLTSVDSGGNPNGSDTLTSIEGIVLTGTASADHLNISNFTSGPVSLYGLGNDDILYGGSFNDLLDGGSGNDLIFGNDGEDTVSGGLGNDTVDGGADTDTMQLDMGNNHVTLSGNSITGDGDDEVSNVERLIVVGGDGGNRFDAGGYGGTVSMFGNGGNDTLIAGTGGGSLDGGPGVDRLVAANDSMTLSNTQLIKGSIGFALSSMDEASLQGSGSGDTLNAAAFSGPVTLEGLGGNDSLVGGSSADSLVGGDNNDTLLGNDGPDTLDGGAGSDLLQGGSHNDSLTGGADDDTLFGNLGNNTLKGDAGSDSLVGDAGDDSLLGGTDNDTLTGGPGQNTLDGGGGELDRLVESLVGLSGTHALTLTSTSLTLSGVPTATTTVANIEQAHLTGSAQADTLDASGFAGQVTLLGGDGADELSGASGSDLIDGGAQTDLAIFKVDDLNVTLTGGALAGQGQDTLISVEAFWVIGGPASQTFDASGFQPPVGSTFGVTLDGGGGSDTLIGSAYPDRLLGNSGNDVLVGNGGADTLDGGAGTGDVVAASGAGPYLVSDTSLVTDGVSDVLTNTEGAHITGTLLADIFDAWGFSGRVTLVGQAGNDELRIATGGGSLLGGDGLDSLRVLGDTDYVLSNDQLEMLGQSFVLSSTESVSITAGINANILDASAYSGHVTLMGAGGADQLKGGLGNDLILGGDGDDLIGGGPGADTLDGGAHGTADTWVETGAVTVTLVPLGLPAVPVDVVTGLERADFTGDDSPNIFNLVGFTGTATLKGGGGNDFLTGGDLADSVLGEAGNDTLTGNAAFDTLNGGAGIDRLVATGDTEFNLSDDRLEGGGTATDTLSSIDEAVLTGLAGSSLFDASAFSGPVTLDGGDGPDTLIGGQVNDSIIGGGGDDHLEGRQGNDTLTGLEGNDFLDGGIGQDLLNGYLGNDTLLGDEGNDTLIGAEGSDSVVGGGGDDLLSHAFDVFTTTVGITMDDTLRGGPGLDTLEGGVGYDVVQEIGDANYLLSNTSLVGEMGNDVLSNFEAAQLTGGESPNLFNTLAFTGPVTLSGLGSNDTFLSGGQDDSILGGQGNGDQLQVSGNFTFTLSDTLLTGLGTDTLSLVEQAVITGGVDANQLNAGAFTLGPVTLIGAEGNDTLIGGRGNDSLDAGDGDDSLTGNAGTNTLLGGAGTNRVIETSDVHYTLSNDLLVGTTTVPGASLTDVLSNTLQAHLVGGPSGNLLNASAFTGTVTLDGAAGADTLLGGFGSDWLIGGDDEDSLVASADVDFTLGNTLFTGLGSDTLDGVERASLTGGASSNRLDAGAFTLGPVTLVGLAGADTLVGGQKDDRLDGGTENDVFTGGDGNDLFLGGADAADQVDESVTGAGNFVLTATLLTGRGTDTLSGIDRAQLTGGSAGNHINAQAAAVPVTLIGGPGNDTLIGGAFNDNLAGQTDDDVLTGNGGRDTLDGGVGDADLLLEVINADRLFLNNTSLVAEFNGLPDAIDDALIGNNFERASLTGGAANNQIDAIGFNHPVTLSGLGGNDSLRGGTSADSLLGGEGNDTLLGLSGDNTLDGGLGNDSLLGGSGNESLLGGGGNDTLTALAGNDTIDGGPNIDLLVEQVSGLVVLTDSSMSGLGSDAVVNVELVQLNGSDGNDTLDASAYTAGTVTLTGGDGDDILRGGSQHDSLVGGNGNDRLSGNGGSDTMDGGAGTDWVIETANGLVTLTNTGLVTGAGTDVHLSLERASLSGGTGSDTLDASAYTLNAVILHGGDGNDSLIGTGLNDSLYGDGGDDALDGRLGDDSLTGGNGADRAVAAGNLNFTVGAASLVGNGTDSLAPDVEAVSLTGGASDNIFSLLGWLGSATVAGGAGVDRLSVGGSASDDNFLVEAARVIRGAANIAFASVEELVVDAGAGQDTLTLADALAADLSQNLTNSTTATSLTAVTLLGGDGDDRFHFKPLVSLNVFVDGGAHPVGDTLEFDAGPVLVEQLPGLLMPEDHQPVNYTRIEVVDFLRNLLHKVFAPFITR